ncbi:ABC transporter substrate-binding protein [Oceanibacterium hippocampi]|uniref:Leucine-binding protein domain-containing protein n=1 Tax=Oceanibacterium hippocampi TaxID=745714 RepID=A0A1Y5TTV1_9PROT|nr:ABC transporter substrate-binding protein [Oceanibacterium hippocampi]SLN71503.1 hypothetical protein OCH7691_03388 [Oceanibacterium hippocampi]
MTEKRKTYQITRRGFVAGSAAAAGIVGFPGVLRAQAAPVKIGLVHPVTGFLQFNGTQCRFGAVEAIKEINASGGIKSLGGAQLEAVLGDAQSKPEIGASEVEKFNEAGVSCIVGAYASGISMSTTQVAAKYGIPHVVDVGVTDKIVERGLDNVFRFGPGYGVITKVGVERFIAMNDAAGKPVKSIMIVHEDSTPFGGGTAALLEEGLTAAGFSVTKVGHPTPHRDFSNIVLQIKSANPDVVIPSSYPNEYELLVRTMQQQRVQPKGIYSVLGGSGSSYKFLAEYPEACQYIMDCNHWYNPKSAGAMALRKISEAAGVHFTYEVFLAYSAVKLVADAMEQAASADRKKIIDALAASNWSDHIMPYGPTKFVNGQNQGAQPLNLQYQGQEIEVIAPADYATSKAVFPRPA